MEKNQNCQKLHDLVGRAEKLVSEYLKNYYSGGLDSAYGVTNTAGNTNRAMAAARESMDAAGSTGTAIVKGADKAADTSRVKEISWDFRNTGINISSGDPGSTGYGIAGGDASEVNSAGVKEGYRSLRDYNLPGYGFKIGDSLVIENPVISAPLAGISDNTFRIFARSFGSALNFSEMVTGYGIYLGHKKSLDMTRITGYERPCALQVFGSDPEVMDRAACRMEIEADIIDINMGCPVPKILRAQSGGYLLRDEVRVGKIIKKLASSLKKPVTVKTRMGWDMNNINAVKIAKIAEESGACAITIHGRTVKQGFSGKVDYGIIRKVKENISIPVIASGDIDLPGRAYEVLDCTGCDGVMIGRAARGAPWVFTDTLFYIASRASGKVIYDEKYPGKSTECVPDVQWRQELARLYLELLIYFKGEDRAIREFRKHLSWIFKGVRGITHFREKFFGIKDYADACSIIDEIRPG